MSEILKFILDNFSRLRALDFLLILLVAGLLGFALFVFFRWLFHSRYKAQAELIQIKEDTIVSVQRQLGLSQKETNDTKIELAEIRLHISQLTSEHERLTEQAKNYQNFVKDSILYAFTTQTALSSILFFLVMHDRVSQAYDSLLLYLRVQSADQLEGSFDAKEITKQIDAVRQKLWGLHEVYEPLVWKEKADLQIHFDSAKLTAEYQPDQMANELDQIIRIIHERIDKVLAAVTLHRLAR